MKLIFSSGFIKWKWIGDLIRSAGLLGAGPNSEVSVTIFPPESRHRTSDYRLIYYL